MLKSLLLLHDLIICFNDIVYKVSCTKRARNVYRMKVKFDFMEFQMLVFKVVYTVLLISFDTFSGSHDLLLWFRVTEIHIVPSP